MNFVFFGHRKLESMRWNYRLELNSAKFIYMDSDIINTIFTRDTEISRVLFRSNASERLTY